MGQVLAIFSALVEGLPKTPALICWELHIGNNELTFLCHHLDLTFLQTFSGGCEGGYPASHSDNVLLSKLTGNPVVVEMRWNVILSIFYSRALIERNLRETDVLKECPQEKVLWIDLKEIWSLYSCLRDYWCARELFHAGMTIILLTNAVRGLLRQSTVIWPAETCLEPWENSFR